ncbi:hypothetical protein MUK42_05478 [Musa troglodytarum]|uniref:Uncharacterized protein n=1 Tax=Musa troglodytarum TaxID=320322 RepID=A0A9E7GB07_9LILI|nr:hypothetical protein MUK42_05478 [Musa troglodytarum]
MEHESPRCRQTIKWVVRPRNPQGAAVISVLSLRPPRPQRYLPSPDLEVESSDRCPLGALFFTPIGKPENGSRMYLLRNDW